MIKHERFGIETETATWALSTREFWMPEKSPGASYSALQGNISRDLLGGLSNSNQTLCCLIMPTSIPVCSGVQLSGPGYEGQVVHVHLTSKCQHSARESLGLPKLAIRQDSSVQRVFVQTQLFLVSQKVSFNPGPV